MRRNSCIQVFGGKDRRDHWEDINMGGRIILKWILEQYDGLLWIELICLRIRTSGGIL
jgi:hypothetical protein